MRKNFRAAYPLIIMFGDFLALLAAFLIAYVMRVTFDPRPLIEQIPLRKYLSIYLFLTPFWIVIFASLGLYSASVYGNRLKEIMRLFIGSFIGILFIIGYDFAIDPNSTIFPARLVAVYAFLLGFSLLVLERQILWQIKKFAYRYGIGVEKLMIVGSGNKTRQIANQLGNTPTSGYRIVAIVGAKSALPKGFDGRHFSSISQAIKQLERMRVDTIIQTKLYQNEAINRRLQQAALVNYIDFKLALSEHDYFSARTQVELLNYTPIMHMSPTPLLGWGRIYKRAFDTILSLLLIILLAPLFILIALAILVFDFGPVIFRQTRLTRRGKKFTAYKFRTMKAKYSGRDPEQVFKELGREELIKEFRANRAKVKNDPRVSWIGRILRRWSLDELPQLFNVLKGEISLIGPRTIPPNEAEHDLREKSPIILSVKTGISGLAQVSGRSDLTLDERIRLDQYYVQNWSPWLDLKIVIKTIGTVISNTGAQ